MSVGDLSSNNDPPGAPINLAAYAAQREGLRRRRRRWVTLKATQDTDYVWPAHAVLARQAHSLGLHVIHYHLLTATAPGRAQAKWFLAAAAGGLAPGDLFMPDVEAIGAEHADDAARRDQLEQFLTEIDAAAPATPPIIYLPDWYAATRPKLAAMIRVARLPVVASDYSHRRPVNTARLWQVMHQYTDTGRAAGVSGNVDLNRWLLNPRALFRL